MMGAIGRTSTYICAEADVDTLNKTMPENNNLTNVFFMFYFILWAKEFSRCKVGCI
jgi:hypothetical protein